MVVYIMVLADITMVQGKVTTGMLPVMVLVDTRAVVALAVYRAME
jgi:antibiotic biosynthesis monooxygenase (ABM) superfamily enzyme